MLPPNADLERMKNMETRYIPIHEMKTRAEEDGKLYILGYFAVFDSDYNLWPGATESIAPGAFDDSISGDVRALYNHNDDIILGRSSAGTLKLSQDQRGLWGEVEINQKDTDAMNAYERIARGDITGCSFGFDIEKEEFRENPDGSVHWTIKKVNPLYEVSPCVFPAYEATNISARKNQFDQIQKRRSDEWKEKMKGRLRNGIKSTDAE